MMDTTAEEKPKRVRVRNDHRSMGVVFDVDDEGWVYWFGDDRSCHVSRPDYLEPVS
jgi:hypothetical protein